MDFREFSRDAFKRLSPLPISYLDMPRNGRSGGPFEEGPVASISVAAANQTAQASTEAQPEVQALGATPNVPHTTPIVDTVTLSDGAPRPTSAEEAGLFKVAAPTISSAFSAPPLNAGATAVAGGANNGGNAARAVTQAAAQPAAAPAVTPRATTASNVSAKGGASTPANPPANAPSAPSSEPSSAAASAQAQNQLLQFTEYLQQLGLSPQAQNQMLDSARLLTELDPPAFQQSIVALRAQAASLAAKANSDAQPPASPVAAAKEG